MTSIGDWFTAVVWAYTIQENSSIGIFHPRGYVIRDKIFVEADVDPRYLVFVLPDHGTPLTPY